MHAMRQARGPERIASGWYAPYLAERALLTEQLFGVEHCLPPGVIGCDAIVSADHSGMHAYGAVLC